MKILDLFKTENSGHWLDLIEKSDWSAGAFLVRLIRSAGFYETLGDGSTVLLLTEGSELISYCTYAKYDDIQPTELTPWIGFVYTFPEHRGKRHIALLFDEVKRLAAEQGVEEVFLSTNHIGLYEKYGFEYRTELADIEGNLSRVYALKIQSEVRRDPLEIVINDKISYIEATDDPLSADIGIIRDSGRTWLFDVGADRRVLEHLPSRCSIVLSHFHPDHIANMNKVSRAAVYMTKNTQKYTKIKGRMVHGDLRIGGVHLFLLPSSHAKGCIGLEVDGEYAFVGDALYCKREEGKLVYNAQLLQSLLETLRRIDAPKLLVSHHPGLIRDKAEVIAELEAVYALRGEGPDIFIEAF